MTLILFISRRTIDVTDGIQFQAVCDAHLRQDGLEEAESVIWLLLQLQKRRLQAAIASFSTARRSLFAHSCDLALDGGNLILEFQFAMSRMPYM
jgi:hypothetical protein